MLSELMSTYASMTVLYLWTLSGLHVCTQPLEIFERSTEIAANGLRTLQSQLCQLRRTPSACLTVMKPTLHSHLVSNVTSGSGDLRPQARPSGLRRTSSVFGTTGWPEPCIPSTTTTANKSSSDDVIPKAEHLLSICNSSAYPRPCPGQTRYHVRYVPGNLVTLVIVCNNHCIDNLFNGESDATRAAIHTRFREILCNLEDV